MPFQPLPEILRSIDGRRLGLDKDNQIIVDQERRGGNTRAQVPVLSIADTEILTAQVLTLNSAPTEIIPAPGEGKFIVVDLIQTYKPAGTAYAVVTSLIPRYINSAGHGAAGYMAATEVLNEDGILMAVVHHASSVGSSSASIGIRDDTNAIDRINAAIVMSANADPTTGDTSLFVRAYYRIFDADITV